MGGAVVFAILTLKTWRSGVFDAINNNTIVVSNQLNRNGSHVDSRKGQSGTFCISANAECTVVADEPLLGLRKTRHGRIAICDESLVLTRDLNLETRDVDSPIYNERRLTPTVRRHLSLAGSPFRCTEADGAVSQIVLYHRESDTLYKASLNGEVCVRMH